MRDCGQAVERASSDRKRDSLADEREPVARCDATIPSHCCRQFRHKRLLGSEPGAWRRGELRNDFLERTLHSACESAVAAERNRDCRKPGGHAREQLSNRKLNGQHRVMVAPATVSVPTGGEQVFTASGAAPGVTWSVNGIAGGNSTVGTIATTSATTALYTAPSAPPSPPTVTVTATSTADSSKFGNASVTVTCSATNSISPLSASVSLGQSQAFSASFCLAVGATISWDVDGIAGGSSAFGTIVPSGAATGLYTAPTDLPGANPVTIHATVSPQPSGGPEIAAATITIASGVTVTVVPASRDAFCRPARVVRGDCYEYFRHDRHVVGWRHSRTATRPWARSVCLERIRASRPPVRARAP